MNGKVIAGIVVVSVLAVSAAGQASIKKWQSSHELLEPGDPGRGQDYAQRYGCLGCHDPQKRQASPSFAAIATRQYSVKRIVELVHKPVPVNWPQFSELRMPPMPDVPSDHIRHIAAWISSLHDDTR